MHGCLAIIVVVFIALFCLKLLSFAVLTGLATSVAFTADEPGIASIPFAATIVLLMGVAFFIFLGASAVYAVRHSEDEVISTNDESEPTAAARVIVAVFGACVGAIIGAIIGILVAFGDGGWTSGLLVFGISILACAGIGYVSPNFGGEFLSAIFQWIEGMF